MDVKFGEFRLSSRERQLHGPGGPIELGDRSFEILTTLLEKPNLVVSKTDLLETVWPGLTVEENTLQVHVHGLRKAIGSGLIRTVHGRGYQYVGPKPQTVGPASQEDTQSADEAQSLTIGDHLAGFPGRQDRRTTSVAVLPFTNMSGETEMDLFAEGLTEDLITELARYVHLSVIGHRISSQFRDAETDRAEISRTLGADFILSGSVRKMGPALRVSVRLTDLETDALAWVDRFDRQMGDIFALQDEIVGAVIARLSYNLDAAAAQQRRRDPTSSSSAYSQFLAARAHWRNGDPLKAVECAHQAIEIDPGYGRAHAYAGYFHAFGLFGQWFDLSADELMTTAREEIELALSIDRADPFILQRASMTYLMLGEPQTALRFAETAAAQSACDGEILVIHGLCLACCGKKQQGEEMLRRAIELEPRLAPGCYSALAETLHMRRDYSGSQAVLDTIPDPPAYFHLLSAANLARMGKPTEAEDMLGRLPDSFDCALTARAQARLCALPEDSAHWLESFRLAGIELDRS